MMSGMGMSGKVKLGMPTLGMVTLVRAMLGRARLVRVTLGRVRSAHGGRARHSLAYCQISSYWTSGGAGEAVKWSSMAQKPLRSVASVSSHLVRMAASPKTGVFLCAAGVWNGKRGVPPPVSWISQLAGLAQHQGDGQNDHGESMMK